MNISEALRAHIDDFFGRVAPEEIPDYITQGQAREALILLAMVQREILLDEQQTAKWRLEQQTKAALANVGGADV